MDSTFDWRRAPGLIPTRLNTFVEGWSRDGRYLVVDTQNSSTALDVGYIDLESNQKIVTVVGTSANEWSPALSPNGTWLAYVSDETGRSEVFVTTFPKAEGKWQVSAEGGDRPAWSGDGSRIYFLNKQHVMTAAVHNTDGRLFAADSAKPVTPAGDHVEDYAVSMSGRMVTITPLETPRPPINVIINWREMLPRE